MDIREINGAAGIGGVRTAAVVGSGLIGTSVALALRRRGVVTYLHDADPGASAAAANRGAGILGLPPSAVDLTVVAVPPCSTAAVVAECQAKGLSRVYTDVAGVKSGPVREFERLGGDLGAYVAGHPMAGSERSGPRGASADLFDGRVWVLTPDARTRPAALRTVAGFVTGLGARPVVMTPAEHDRIVSRTSHVPHLISAILAARLDGAGEEVLRLCGAGIRDTTRVAAGNAELWTDILRANADEVATELSEIAADLLTAVRALHGDPEDLTALLERGNAGRAALTGAPVRLAEAVAR
ncbi:prephenate dehydrogenase [Nocardia transvalensis]|uniref:Prephenate dehydrogenase n=1 Tax=Nocardia transvalensis TaxID=37333 RepID=A0A7W9PGT4_9NOCA|nr:prephenate dehydrogenase [Nocardia transvalensis]MBB5915353.1 prephenate dehydrogenase [Nocardia transvalensis]